MKKGLVIADAGPIFSLALINKLDILTSLFSEVKIATAVWEEITLNKKISYYNRIHDFFNSRTVKIKGFNELTFSMDYGESESLILYRELNAEYLLIDDKKARLIAENFEMKCIGVIGILAIAKKKKLIKEIRPYFIIFLNNKRYYALPLLNAVLKKIGEEVIEG